MKIDNTPAKATVLIVDDSPTYIQSLAKLLKQDYRILVATGGPKALELAAGEQQPDLVLLDVEMPGMDGYEVCRRLKADPRTRDIPVIFVTARDKAVDQEEGFSLGAVDYIPKPFHPAVVRVRVKSQTERRRAKEALESSEKRYRQLFAGSRDALMVLTLPSLYFISGNPKTLEMFGVSDEAEFTTLGPWDVSPERQPGGQLSGEKAQEMIQVALQQGSHFFEWTHQRLNGEEFPATVLLNRVELGDEEVLIQATVRDITEQKLAEQKIRTYTRELERKQAQLEELYRQLDAEMDKARQLHEQNLPRELPSTANTSFAAYYQPAKKVGGDYYNVIQKDNKLVIYLTDVTGHGLDGAMLNIFVKEAINSYISLRPGVLQPEKILRYLHGRYSGEDYPGDYFVCIFLAVMELQTLELNYASAGFHCSPLIAQGGRQEILYCEGPPISTVFPPGAMVFEEKRRPLSPGTTIIFTTDGLLEQTGHNREQYGDTGRLEALFYQNSHLTPEKIMELIKADFHHYIDTSTGTDDDITFLIMQVKADRA